MAEVSMDEAMDKIGIGRFHLLLVVIGSILNAAEAIEVYILSILDPLLRCDWHISSFEAAVLTSSVFGGMLLGGPILGAVADTIGRRDTLLVTAIATVYFGILSGLAPSFGWLVALRAILGFFLNGLLLVTLTIVSEFTPTRYRGLFLLITFTVWPIGGLFLTGIAYTTVGTLGWRGLLIVNSLPLLIPAVAVFLLPRSPRFLLAQGRVTEAQSVLDRISRMNKCGPFADRLVLPVGVSDSSPLKDLGRLKAIWFTIAIVCFLYFGQGFIYMGHVLIVVLLPQTAYSCLQNPAARSIPIGNKIEDLSCCAEITGNTYIDIAVSCVGELLSGLLTLPLIDCVGRRYTLAVNGFLGGVVVLLLALCQPHWSSTLLMLVSRSLITAFTIVLLIYNAEIVPTSIRNAAIGLCQTFSFLGSLVTPFISQMMIPAGLGSIAVFIYSASLLVVAFASVLLPLETKDQRLTDTADDTVLVGKTAKLASWERPFRSRGVDDKGRVTYGALKTE